MKILIVLVIISCFQLVFGDCPDCDRLSRLYEIIGCTVLCRRKECPTNYSCRKLLDKYKARRKCYFDGQYYEANAIIPGQYPRIDGETICTYQCFYDPGSNKYFISEVECVANPKALTEDQCNKMLQIAASVILQTGTAVVYTPGECKIGLVCKCCSFFGKFYKRGTVFNVGEQRCTCLCPPIMLCK